MKYTRHLNYNKRKRFLFRLRLFFASLALVLILGSAALYYAVMLQRLNPPAATSTLQSKSYAAPEVKIFSTPYFQLQTNSTWTEISRESNANKFVYRSMRANLVEHELVIYVNQIPENLAANRVLPVDPRGDFELIPQSVTEHCMKTAGGSRIDNPLVTMQRVKFRCDADSTDYSVLVGMTDGSSSITMRRPNGTKATYAMRYSNLRALYDDTQLTEIVSKFQVR